MTNLIDYAGFQIDQYNQVYHNGKPVFAAWWQYCTDLDAAKKMIDASNAAAERLRAVPGSLNRAGGSCELENGSEASERFREWAELRADAECADGKS